MLYRCCAVVAVVFTVLLPSLAPADAIPGVTTLQDLIDRGSSLQNGVVISNLLYYNFTYAGAPIASTPTAAQIGVTTARSFGGLTFSAAWNSTNGTNPSSLISYSVQAVTTNPQLYIYDAALDFQSTVNAAGAADNASVTESFADGSTLASLTSLNWFNPGGTIDGITPQQHGTSFSTPALGLRVVNGIEAHTGVGSTGSSAISYVDNIFFEGQLAPAPEPAVGLLWCVGAAMLLRRRSVAANH